MRALFKLILWLILLSPFALAAAAWFALSDQALVLNDARLSHQDIAHAQAVLKKYDPRRMPAGTDQQIELSERDLNLAANYLLQRIATGGAQVRIHPGFVDAVGTLRIPGLPKHNYLNVSLQLRDDNGRPLVGNLQLGDLNIPQPRIRSLPPPSPASWRCAPVPRSSPGNCVGQYRSRLTFPA